METGDVKVGDVVYVEGASAILGDVLEVDIVEDAVKVRWREVETTENADDLTLESRPRVYLNVRFDVTDLNEEQRGQLALEVQAQGESSDGHPAVEVDIDWPDDGELSLGAVPVFTFSPGHDGLLRFRMPVVRGDVVCCEYADCDFRYEMQEPAARAPDEYARAAGFWKQHAARAHGLDPEWLAYLVLA